MSKVFIKNRHDKKICVLIEKSTQNKGLVFIMHGLGSFKESPVISACAEVFRKNNFTVVRFDATHTIGESEGKYDDANITNYYEDLEDVINWSKKQKWYKEPFYLVGHSLGAMSILLYTEKYPNKIKALAPMSTVVSGKLWSINYSKKDMRQYNKTGFWIRESRTKPGVILKLKWHQYVKEMLKYDTLKNTGKITMPILLIVGENDTRTPLFSQKTLYDKLTSKKELHVIKGAEHTFKEEKHLSEIRTIFNKWIKKTNK
jgi:pimeloyl-ACP methyl ester carboxylesterase